MADDEIEPFPHEQAYRVEVCKHARTTLVRNERTVYCRDCDTRLDPFEVLSDLIAHFTEFDVRRDRMHTELKSLEARAEQARAEMKRAQGARSRMRRKWKTEGDDFDAIASAADPRRPFQFPPL